MTLTAEAEALFVSSLQPSDHPSFEQIVDAIRTAQQIHGGPLGCAAAFAEEYGDHPVQSAGRMRWALSLVGASSLALAA